VAARQARVLLRGAMTRGDGSPWPLRAVRDGSLAAALGEAGDGRGDSKNYKCELARAESEHTGVNGLWDVESCANQIAQGRGPLGPFLRVSEQKNVRLPG